MTFRNAVVTDNRKHCQMRFSEAFALSEELAINRCEMQISAKFSVVWEQVQEQLEIRCSIHLSYGRECVKNTFNYSTESTFDRAISEPQNVHSLA